MKANNMQEVKSIIKDKKSAKKIMSAQPKKKILKKKIIKNTVKNCGNKNSIFSHAKNNSEAQNPNLKKIHKKTNFEDISTYYKENENYKTGLDFPLLISIETEKESEFINIKLGESDSKVDINPTILQKPKNNIDESCEIFDFTDKTNVDYVLNNLSILSESQSFKEPSKIFDECDKDDDSKRSKAINQIRIFNVKQSIQSLNKCQ